MALPADRIELIDGVAFFLIEVTPAGGSSCWEVRRRYSEFVELRKCVGLQEDSIAGAPFPPKLLFACAGERLEARRLGLEAWLRELLKEPMSLQAQVAQPLSRFLADLLSPQSGGLQEAFSLFPEPRQPRGSSFDAVSFDAVEGSLEASPAPEAAVPAMQSDVLPAAGAAAEAYLGEEPPPGAPLAALRRRLSGLRQRLSGAATSSASASPTAERRGQYQRPASWSLPSGAGAELPFSAAAACPRPAGSPKMRHTFTACLPPKEMEVEQAPVARDEDFAECARLISRDIPRTFYGNPSVDRIRLQIAEVLRSHARKDPELGYTQGMCFAAAAVCLSNDSPEEATLAFEKLMERLRGLWLPGFPAVMRCIPLFQALLAERDPEVLGHLVRLGLDLEMVLPKAWLTLLARWLPLPNLLEALPFLMREGLTGMVAITLLLLLYHRWFLMGCQSLEEALLYLGSLPSKPPPERLIDMSTVALPGLHARLGSLDS